MVTCYKKVPDIEEIGQQLLTKYDDAKHIESDKINALISNEPSLSSSELVYCKFSPNFCQRNLNYGIYGTSGRQCWLGINGPSSCSGMCCGGPVDHKLVIKDKEQCKFVWCCSVTCEVVGNYTATEYYCQ